MGSCDSNCCTDKLGAYNTNTLKTQRKKQSYTRLQTQNFINQLMIHTELCISPNDITKCESLSRILQVLHKYNQWLSDNSLISRSERKQNKQILDYSQYYDDIINSHIYSLELFLSDIKHVKHAHEYTQINRYLNENLESCLANNCFNMQHCFSQSNNVTTHSQYHKIIDPLQPLTQLHCYIFHTGNISQFDIRYTAPINCYIVATFCENIHRQLRNYEQTMANNIIHLCALYFDGKRAKEPVDLFQLVNYIENKMKQSTLNHIWLKIDSIGHGIDCDEDDLESLLLLCSILNIAVEHKDSGSQHAPKINKWELKEAILPIAQWVKNEKMKHHAIITKDEFRETMTLWLREYTHSVTNHGIIVDNKQQCLILKKYGICNLFMNECIDDYLVFNCDKLNTVNEKESLVNWMLLNCSKCAKLIVSRYINGCELQFSVPTDVIDVLWQFLV